jgi:uncharacterized protein YndB with AHSA1/START domain
MSSSHAIADIDASQSRVWEVLVDVESWPEWTASMTSVRRLENGPLRIGSSARIEQPKLRPMVWTVNELVPEQAFTWTAKVPGVVVTGKHTLTALDEGRTRLALAAEGSGPLAFLTDLLTRSRVRKYVTLEAAGIKAAAEAAEGHSPA